MSELKKCPCGSIPYALYICESASGDKYSYVSGSCCGAWEIEFRSNYADIDSEEIMDLAIEAWNEAPRVFEE